MSRRNAIRARATAPLAALGAAMLLAVAGCGAGTRTVTQAGLPTTAAPAPAGTTAAGATAPVGAGEAPSRVVGLSSFQSPTGNIGCAIAGGLARCYIVSRSWRPPARPSSCPTEVDYGQGLEVGASGAGRLVCAGDTARNPASARLAYRTAAEAEGFVCVSRATGMTCTDRASGHGFELSRERYRVF
jgi:hypothetical protein